MPTVGTASRPDDYSVITTERWQQLANDRRAAKLSQRAVAEKIGVSQALIALCESGKRRPSEALTDAVASLLHHCDKEGPECFGALKILRCPVPGCGYRVIRCLAHQHQQLGGGLGGHKRAHRKPACTTPTPAIPEREPAREEAFPHIWMRCQVSGCGALLRTKDLAEHLGEHGVLAQVEDREDDEP